MKNIFTSLFLIICMLLLSDDTYAQCTAVTPSAPVFSNIQLSPGPNPAGTFEADFTFDIDCTVAAGCGNADLSSLIWHISFLGHGSPAPNGTITEYSTETFFDVDCDNTFVVDGDTNGNGICLAPKRSTCVDFEMGQLFDSFGVDRQGTFSRQDVCVLLGGDLSFTVTGLCPGQTYDVYIWEIEVSYPPDTDPALDIPGGPFLGIEEAIACMTGTVLDESDPTPVTTLVIPGAVAPISSPVFSVSGLSVCNGPAAGLPDQNGDYSSTHQSIPSAMGSDNGSGAACLETMDVNTDGSAGPIMSPNTVSSDITFNAIDDRGANTVVVNCRDNPSISFPTPNGCKGLNDLNTPLCDDDITTWTNAVTYLYVENVASGELTPVTFGAPDFSSDFSSGDITLIGANTDIDYPTCYDGTGVGTNACNVGGSVTTDYPNNYTGLFGPFVRPDGCRTNFSGSNPFNGTFSPFDLPGVTTIKDDDGVVRSSVVLCLQYEDDCDGSKSRSCIRFLSDVPPITAMARTCPETCAGANDGEIIITGITGGSPDECNAGTGTTYTFTLDGGVVAATQVGDAFVISGVAPGSHTVEVGDPLADACGSACPQVLSVDVVAAIEGDVMVTTVGGCDATDDNTIDVSLSGLIVLGFDPPAPNGTVDFSTGAYSDNATTITTSGLYENCGGGVAPADFVVEICVEGYMTDGDPTNNTLDLFINGGFSGELAAGSVITNGGPIDPAGTLDGTDVTPLPVTCFTQILANATANAGASISSLVAGQNVNGITLGVAGFDNDFIDSHTFTNVTFTINDLICAPITMPADFTDCAGADISGGGTVASTDLMWVPNSNGTGGTPTAVQLAIGAGGTTATFTITEAQMFTGTYCYTVSGFLPGLRFADDGLIPTCTNGECCPFSAEVCFDATTCVPAELTAFNGIANDDVNELTWETASEINTGKFVVERSIDGKDFFALGTVEAAGNSLVALTYNFTDVSPLTVGYYRLNIIDLDGSNEYSDVVVINRKSGKGIVEVFPIPTDNDVTVQYEVEGNTDVTFTLTDVLGRIVSQQVVEATAGLNNYSIDMTNQATGLYFVTFSDGTIEQTRRVIKN